MFELKSLTRMAAPALASAILAASLALSPAAHAQSGIDEAKAKEEGTVTWYTSTPIAIAQKTADLFTQKTGIKVDLFRSGGSQIMRRFQQEAASGRMAADVLTASDQAEITSLAKTGVFEAFKPEHFDKVPEMAKDPSGAYTAQRLNMVTVYYRSDKVAPQDVPKTLADLTDPKYKDQLVMADPSFSAMQVAVTGMIAKNLGWDYYQKLAKNGAMVVQGGQQVSDMVKRGERLIAVAASNSYAADAKLAGFPIEAVYPKDGTFIVPAPTAIIKGGPHPNAAKLFMNFLLSDEAQQMYPAAGGYSAREDIPAPAGSPTIESLTITPIDLDYIDKEGPAIKRQFTKIFQ
jgi:iron(III) transport system substrate-binding protein